MEHHQLISDDKLTSVVSLTVIMVLKSLQASNLLVACSLLGRMGSELTMCSSVKTTLAI